MVDNFRLTVDSNTEIEPLETVRDVRMKGQSLVDNRVATIPQMTGATSSSNGSAGVVPTPSVGDREKFLRGDGTWAETSSGGSNVSVDQILDDGVNIMDITIDNVTTHIYAPESDPNAVVDVEVNGVSVVTNNVAEITITESVTDVVDANGDSLVDANGVAHVTGEVVDVVNGDGDSLVDEYGVAHVTGDITDVVDSNNTTLVDQDGVAHISAKVTDVQFEGVSILDDNNVANIKTPFITFSAPTLDYNHAAYIDESSAWKDRDVHEWVAPCDCMIYACSPNSYTVTFTIGDFTYGTYKNAYGNYYNQATENIHTMLPVSKGTIVNIKFVGQIDTDTTYKKIRYIPFKEASSLQGYYLQPFLDYSNKITVPWEDPESDNALICEYIATTDGMINLGLSCKNEYIQNQTPYLKYNINDDTSINYVVFGNSLSNSIIMSKGDKISIYDMGNASQYEYVGNIKFIPYEKTSILSNVVSPIPDYSNAEILNIGNMPTTFESGYLFNCRYDSGSNSKNCIIELTNPQSDSIILNTNANGTFMKQSHMPLNGTETLFSFNDLCNSGNVYFVPYATINAQPFIVSDVEVDGVSVVDDNGVAHITGGGGGSTVTVTPIQTTGTKIAEIDVDGVTSDLYAPNGGGGGSTVSVTQKVSSGENIASITVDGVATELYATNTTYSNFVGATSQADGSAGLVPAPTTSDVDKYLKSDGTWATVSGGGGGSTVTITPSLASGIKVADYSIDSTSGSLYAPINADDMTLSAYNALTTAQKNDGTVRFIPEVKQTAYDMSNITEFNGATMTNTSTSNSTTVAWNGSTTASVTDVFYYTTPIDVTSYSSITYDLITTTSYKTSAQYYIHVALSRNAPASSNFDPSQALVDKYYNTINNEYLNETMDVSSLTGELYLVVVASGWNLTIGNITLVPSSVNASQIKYMSETYALVEDMTGATASVDGTNGLVPMPSAGDNTKYLRGDGTWKTPTNTTYSDFTGATPQAAGAHGLVPAPTTSDTAKFLKGDGSWGTPDSGSDVSVTQIQSTGTKIATITVDNVDTDLYAPNGGSGGASELDDLDDVEITSPTNGQVLKYNSVTQKWENKGSSGTKINIYDQFDSLLISDRYATASLSNGFSFSMSEEDGTWSTSATAYTNIAIDLTDYDSLELEITISSQTNYGAFWVTLSNIKYTWSGSQWAQIYFKPSAIKITESGTYTVDVSELSGEYYIYMGGTTGKDTVAAGDCDNTLNGGIAGNVDSVSLIVSGSSEGVVPNPEGEPTDTLNTIEIDGVIYDLPSGSGEKDYVKKKYIYTLTVAAAWQYFTDPQSDNPLLIEAVGGGAIRSYRVDADSLPTYESYTTIGTDIMGHAINMCKSSNGDIGISVNDSSISGETIKVYEVIGYSIEADNIVKIYDSGSDTVPATQNTDITYIDGIDISNYDLIIAAYSSDRGSVSFPQTIYATGIIDEILNDTDNDWVVAGYGERWAMLDIGATSFRVTAGSYGIYKLFVVKLGGSGNANIEELTQGEYNVLPSSQKENGTMYLVHDGDEEVDLTVRMVDYTSTSGTASAVGSLNANFLAWHAFASENTFNANVNGEYWAGDGEGAYLQFDFANAVSITKVAYASYQYSSFDLMYSTDGTTYTKAETLTQADQGTVTPTKQDYILSEPIASVISIRFVCNGAYNIGALHIYGNDGNITPNRIYLNGRKYAEVSDPEVKIEYYDYAYFSGKDSIVLPFKLNADYKITVTFDIPVYSDDNAIIGNSASNNYLHISQYASRYYTSTGTSETYFEDTLLGKHTYVINDDGTNKLDGVVKTSYTPTTDNNIALVVGGRDLSRPGLNLRGKIYEYIIESISTGEELMHLLPIKLKAAGVIIKSGLYDSVSGEVYTATGVTLGND